MEITVHLGHPICECEVKDNTYLWNVTDAGIWVQCSKCLTHLSIPRETLVARWNLTPQAKKPATQGPLPDNVFRLPTRS